MSDDRPDRDDPFHPLGEAAEEDFERMLEETEYDAELGMEMARDALRLTKGEIGEEEFYDRYHEDVIEEFGEDERPMAAEIEAARAEDGEGAVSEALSTLGVGSESRRDVMKKMGAGAGVVGLGAFGASQGPDGTDPAAAQDEQEDAEDGDGVQWGMTLDLETCDGCLSCVVACNAEHNWNEGANWMYILAYDDGIVESPDTDEFDDFREFNYLIRPCQHCTDAPCEKVCPTTARHTRDEGGLVLTDYDVCIGCRYCQVACPYGVNYFQWEDPPEEAQEMDDDMIYDQRDRWVSGAGPRGVMEKCIFDPARQDGQMGEDMVGTTACEDACPPGAIQFGDMNDPESDPQQYLEDTALARALEHDPEEEDLQEAIEILQDEDDADEEELEEARTLIESEYGTGDSRFRLLEEYNTNPNVMYIGNEPGPHAEQVEGPVAYDDVGMVDNRKNVLDEGTVGFDL
ncbi:4Fe-4S ferredoxin N-terminal domain-containing protein [Natronobacterium texcoconense]|uniref:Prokaryotic molybdopterin-containing oxidoreductase family, iron-sulfur binding subunit n=1 Tax=Natronobacterium texcoconense TaxID=1095778 RepID=A0A1H1C1U4_NATTX|nr:4Fe-4S ferredoxin N-terminal domain-containing protein [Natronobacterium texcoconense]SDQ58109.1 prokaryotic molybdopterin-containing oxidoreductase family, iron-sulfur binding subunit [Natronobacterium texcoconense]